MVPIFPINQIINSIYVNSEKVRLDNSAFLGARKVLQTYYEPFRKRQENVS
jgi:hypothetical protein